MKCSVSDDVRLKMGDDDLNNQVKDNICLEISQQLGYKDKGDVADIHLMTSRGALRVQDGTKMQHGTTDSHTGPFRFSIWLHFMRDKLFSFKFLFT